MTIATLRPSVLVIDDDADFREMITFMCERLGLLTIEAVDCCDGLAKLAQEKQGIRVILLDYFMPGMTPGACAQALKAEAADAIPIVLMTAAPDPQARAMELSLDQWLGKPFDFEAFKEMVIPRAQASQMGGRAD